MRVSQYATEAPMTPAPTMPTSIRGSPFPPRLEHQARRDRVLDRLAERLEDHGSAVRRLRLRAGEDLADLGIDLEPSKG